jgi:hypothetical protein
MKPETNAHFMMIQYRQGGGFIFKAASLPFLWNAILPYGHLIYE